MPERIDGARVLAAIGAVMLIVSLFLDWFPPSTDAWKSFEIVDLLLATLAVATLATAVPVQDLRLPVDRLPWMGLAAAILVGAAIVNHPPAAGGHALEAGAWVGFAGAALITLGGLLSTTRISVVITLRGREQPWVDEEPEPESAEFFEEEEPFAPDEGDEGETAALPAVGSNRRQAGRAS
jgi:hypothetical protein